MSAHGKDDERAILEGLLYLRREAMLARLLPLSNVLCSSIESYLEHAGDDAKMATKKFDRNEFLSEVNSIRRMLLYLSSQTKEVGLPETSNVIVSAIATLGQEYSSETDKAANPKAAPRAASQ